MALSQTVASELLEAFRAGEGVDLVRESVRLVMQKQRGLHGLQLVIPTSTPAWSPRWAGCSRLWGINVAASTTSANLLALVPKSHKDMVAAVFRTAFAQPDPEAASRVWDQVRDQLAATFPKIGPLMDTAKAEVLTFTAFPRGHWAKIWSTNTVQQVGVSDDGFREWCGS